MLHAMQGENGNLGGLTWQLEMLWMTQRAAVPVQLVPLPPGMPVSA